MVGAHERDQRASKDAFALLDQVAAARLRRGLTTVLDTTGLEPARRAGWVARRAPTADPCTPWSWRCPSARPAPGTGARSAGAVEDRHGPDGRGGKGRGSNAIVAMRFDSGRHRPVERDLRLRHRGVDRARQRLRRAAVRRHGRSRARCPTRTPTRSGSASGPAPQTIPGPAEPLTRPHTGRPYSADERDGGGGGDVDRVDLRRHRDAHPAVAAASAASVRPGPSAPTRTARARRARQRPPPSVTSPAGVSASVVNPAARSVAEHARAIVSAAGAVGMRSTCPIDTRTTRR